MTVLLLSCPDRPGLVAAVAGFISDRGGNIVDADQHTDRAHERFLQRVEFDLAEADGHDRFATDFAPLAESLMMEWSLHREDERARIAILVSNLGHCLYDLLGRVALGEFAADVVGVVSNHDHLAEAAGRFDVPFVRVHDDDELTATLDDMAPDLIVLARYMQIVPSHIIDRHPSRIINIHHSFLPAFVGARPYHHAHERGVKMIGATAHYATAELDDGPIIAQDVIRVSHRDDVDRFVRRGRDLEQLVLARAVGLHLEHRVLTVANRTIVFE